jgi:large subunit ribosomal protein L3
MGNSRVTARGIQVFAIDEERNLLLLRGAVPGPNGGYVVIRKGRS